MTWFSFGITLLAFLAAYHFIYEGIVAPSLRIKFRNKLFYLRDALRMLKIERSGALNDSVFNEMQEAINHALNLQHKITILGIISYVIHLEKDPALKASVQRRLNNIEKCDIHEFKVIDTTLSTIFFKITLVNSGAWALYVIPLFMTLFVIGRIRQGIERIRNGTRFLIHSPSGKMAKLPLGSSLDPAKA